MSEGALSTPMDWSNPEWQQAKTTCLSNVQYAAEKCQPVGLYLCTERKIGRDLWRKKEGREGQYMIVLAYFSY